MPRKNSTISPPRCTDISRAAGSANQTVPLGLRYDIQKLFSIACICQVASGGVVWVKKEIV
ncbi:hypothetical protein [Photorhabdus luminescens]|uniref:Uncharacterized protein n=1 Tax=Photorhabdus luminescens subsp. sonorensis TaxID=1173677 RepID=A0A5C4RI98_PHOLU|nr:hypothetical protein [Photorhabdus luminescens]MCW7761473.1 hypothetical protein [Photorhabdus luminescens subsp. venezuelensis]TNH43538.1 hypothetical protein EP164_11235 [Photorhabdus luminescens subsp. sonorensis]